MTRAEAKALFDKFIGELESPTAPPILPIVVRAGDEPNSLIVENFPQPLEREYVFTFRIDKEA